VNGLARAVGCGAVGTCPRLGLSPTSPHIAAGMRSDPPPSLPCATGTIPAATAAADPPLDPPGLCSCEWGLRVGPNKAGSVLPFFPNSGVLVLLSTPMAASWYR